MLKPQKLGQAQRGTIAALLCLSLAIGVFDGLSSQGLSSQPNSAEKTNNPTNQQKQEEGWWKRASEPLTVITFLLVVVGTAQLGLFWLQLTFIRESLDDAKKAADAAEGAASAANKQAKVAEESFAKLERPYVFVFDVKEFDFDIDRARFFVEYSVANYGKMPAIIEGAYIGFAFSDKAEPPLPTLMGDDHSLMTAPILQVGEKREKIREYVPIGMTTGEFQIDVTMNDPFEKTGGEGPVFDVPAGSDVFFRAVVEYRGPSTAGHSTGALWLANYPGAGQLAQRGGEEYNYIK